MIPSVGQAGFDEAALVAAARQGAAEAFTSLVNRYERRIFRLARHITQNPEDAEDVLQETFLKAYEHLEDFQGNSKFYTWLVRIAVNQALMKLRKRKSDSTVSLDEPIDTGEETVPREIAVWDPNPEQTYSREEMRAILQNAIDSLPPAFRSVFALRDIEGLSTEETATILNLTIPAVKMEFSEELTPEAQRGMNEAIARICKLANAPVVASGIPA